MRRRRRRSRGHPHATARSPDRVARSTLAPRERREALASRGSLGRARPVMGNLEVGTPNRRLGVSLPVAPAEHDGFLDDRARARLALPGRAASLAHARISERRARLCTAVARRSRRWSGTGRRRGRGHPGSTCDEANDRRREHAPPNEHPCHRTSIPLLAAAARASHAARAKPKRPRATGVARGRWRSPRRDQVWRTYSKSTARPLMPCFGGAIQLAICFGSNTGFCMMLCT